MEKENFNNTIDTLIRVGLLVLLVATSLTILAPFIIPIVWGIIIAVALFPMFFKTVNILGNKKGLTAFLYTALGLLILVIPTILLAESTISGYQFISEAFQNDDLTIPPPNSSVKTWPLIGEELYKSWELASKNLEGFLRKYSDQIQDIGSWLVSSMTSLGLTVVQFILSIIIAGVLLARSNKGAETVFQFAERLVGNQAEDFVKLTTGTIRSVVSGVVGIAVIQAIASAILFLVAGVPFAGLWAFAILILAIVQMPPLLVIGPIIVFVFSVNEPLAATIFTIFGVFISISDSLLKPVFLGRGVDIPMMVVLLGAIGGMLVFGILGLFVGAVILTLSYKLLLAWLKGGDELSVKE